ncbi:MAG: hypothetical protein IT379_42410, partial [Deltaproteobacteria bacterium]|nr:hypothetical protein [Deltaproteobacteria bacterium]
MAAVRSSSSLFVSSVLCALLVLASSACGDDDEPGPADTGPDATQPDATPDAGPSGIEAYFPEIPEGSGGPQVARALELTTANFDAERIDGPGATGLPGDVLMANDRLRVVIESANRAIGPCPWGGNIVDVDMVRDES